MAEVHPGVRDADVVVHPLNAAVQVYPAAVVLHVVHRVVDVDAVVLVGQVPLQLVATVLVDPELVVDLLECPLHPGLALPDLANLPPQAPLHSIADKVNLLATLPRFKNDQILKFPILLPVVDALGVDLHRPLSLNERLLQVPPARLQLVGEVDVELELCLELLSPVHLVTQPLPDPPVRVPLGGHRLVLPLPDQPHRLVPDSLRLLSNEKN